MPHTQLAVRDRVLSRDESSGETAFKPVTDLIRRHERQIWTLTLEVPAEGGAASLVVFETTDDHPWWRTVDGRWVETQALEAGMRIERADGEALNSLRRSRRGSAPRIVSVVRTGRTASTYNLEVADFHTYFVGDAQVWVHNACDIAARSTGRAKNKLTPDPRAEGPHSTYKNGPDGKTSNYATYEANPRNPSGYQETKRVDVTGRSHRNPDGTIVPTPHVKEAGVKGVRPARPNELP